ncbi:MAG: formylmethanofuran dehydrogenase subunit E family protein [Armatimonadota bacterium]
MRDNPEVLADDINLLRAFHGHIGPWAFAGMRMGRYALKQIDAKPHFGVEADVWCPGDTPKSCMIDGIQFSTGCTLGKQNIRHHVSEEVKACFTNTETGDKITLRLKPQAIDRAVEEMHEKTDEDGAEVINAMSDNELLETVNDA